MNAKLDAVLASFMRIVGGHFLAPGAGPVVEYLIRRFKRAPQQQCRNARRPAPPPPLTTPTPAPPR